jgi:hypothetical protein
MTGKIVPFDPVMRKATKDICPKCSGSLDTGWECNDCGFDAYEIVHASEWKPIETAPRDGTPFLCFHHCDVFSPQTSIDLIWYEPSIKSYTQDGETEVTFAGITHWMPLPAPPLKGSRP